MSGNHNIVLSQKILEKEIKLLRKFLENIKDEDSPWWLLKAINEELNRSKKHVGEM